MSKREYKQMMQARYELRLRRRGRVWRFPHLGCIELRNIAYPPRPDKKQIGPEWLHKQTLRG